MNKKKIIIVSCIAAVAVVAIIVAAILASDKKKKITDDNFDQYVQGISDIYVVKGAQNIDWMKNVNYNDSIVLSVVATPDAIDINRVNNYDLIYMITLDPEKAVYGPTREHYIEKHVEVKVVTESVARKLAESVKTITIWGSDNVDITKAAE